MKHKPHDSQSSRTAMLEQLEQRIGPLHLKQRTGIETEHKRKIFGQGLTWLNIENWVSMQHLIRNTLRLTLLYRRAQANVLDIRITHNTLPIYQLPDAFNGYRILHLSDPHLDITPDMPQALIDTLKGVEYDLCVITGDYRARTYGDYHAALDAMALVRPHITRPVYSVLGNHDTIMMLPDLEAMGIQLLMNEHSTITLAGSTLWLAGVDDPHYFRADNIEKASHEIPGDAPSIFLAHTPEIYKHAAYAGFDALLCGHTHGGQICLPGGKPLYCNATCPHTYCSGSWRYHRMSGYTSRGCGSSVVDARINCPPEITVHHLCNTTAH